MILQVVGLGMHMRGQFQNEARYQQNKAHIFGDIYYLLVI